MQINLEALIHEVKSLSLRQDLSAIDLAHAINAIQTEAHDNWSICTGTDLLGILMVGFRRALGTHSSTEIKEQEMRRLLRNAYLGEEFATTELWHGLQDWQTRNNQFCVLR
jgi:hypothetical protein